MGCKREDGISLETSQWKRALSRVEGRISRFFSRCHTGKWLHIALRGQSSNFSRVSAGNLVFLSNYNGDLRDPLVWPQESPVSMRVARSLSGFLSSQCRVLGPHLELRSEPQASSPVLTWNSEFRWSFNRVSGLVSCTNV